MADPTTLLVISNIDLVTPFGVAVPPFSARGLTQTLEPIKEAGKFRRTVNGGLVNLAAPQFTKYRSVISGSDHDTGAFAGIFPGIVVQVDCIEELGFVTGSGAPVRTVVPDSSRVSGDFTFYRPRLTMMVTAGPTASWDEWAGVTTWSIELEEV